MKILSRNNKIINIPAYGAICGTRINEITFDANDIKNILNARDDQIRNLFENLLTKFPPTN